MTSKAIHRFRRKRVVFNPKSFEYYPWIGVANGFYDLFRSSTFSLSNAAGSVVYGDQFFWENPSENGPPFQNFWGTYFNPITGALRADQVLLEPDKDTLQVTTLKNDTLGLSSYYIGGTCFYDPDSVRVVSAFEDSSISFWPGLPGNLNNVNYQAVPVGALCFAREGERDGVIASGNTTPAPVGESFFNGTWSSTETTPLLIRMQTYFSQTETFNSVSDFCRMQTLAGQDLAIYFCERSGTKTTFSDVQSSGPIFGHQYLLKNNSVFGDAIAIIQGAFSATSTSTEIREISSFGSGPTCQITARDVNNGEYSDGFPIVSVSPKHWTDISIVGTLGLGNTIDITVISGAHSGPDYEQTRTFVENNGNRYEITHDPGMPGSTFTNFHNDLVATLPSDRFLITTPEVAGMPGVFEDPLDWQEANTVWEDDNTTSVGELQYAINIVTPTSNSNYTIEADYRFKDADFLNNQFILIDRDNGKRYHLTVNSTDFVYLTDQSAGGSPPASGTANVNGTTYNCNIDIEENVFWDSGSGELSDMPTPFLLYAANNLNSLHIPPEFSQLYGNDKDWFREEQGIGSN